MLTRKKHTRRPRLSCLKDSNHSVPETVTNDVIRLIQETPDRGDRKLSYLKEVFLTKFVSSDTDPADVRRTRAISKWLSVERENEATNDRLLIMSEEYNILPRVTWHVFRTHAQRLIAKILGDTVPLTALFGGFSGGATTTKSRTESHPAQKYLGKAGITSAAEKWFETIRQEAPAWMAFSDRLEFVPIQGNMLFTVPKTTEIDRVAAKEPDLNMYLQKGVGNFIRRRLRRVGIDLNDQSINQRLARIGSIDGSLATIDLSSASDSLSIELVSAFLPDLWFAFLADIRSPHTLIDGEWHENHMFSSMGNGFTFELESLIFWAIARSVRDLTGFSGIISVYGDDIIVESSIFEDLSWVLGVLGFSVNLTKSFHKGPFRESCGGHYSDGYDISPFYIRKPLTTVRDVITLANQVRKWSQITPDGGCLDPTLEHLWVFLRALVPSELRGGTNPDTNNQLQSYDIPSRELVAITVNRDNSEGGYLLWLDTCEGSTSPRDGLTTSSRSIVTNRYRTRRVRADGRKSPYIFLSEIFTTAEGLTNISNTS